MKKVLSIITIVLEVLFLAGAGIIRYFTERKMGMARHMVYMTRKWSEVVPLEVLRYVVPIVLIIFCIFSYRYFVGVKKTARRIVAFAVTAIFCIAYIVYFIYGFIQSQRDFFEVGLLLSIALLLQIIRLWILMLGKK